MHHLTLELHDQEGALLRLLGTAERRGWRSVTVSAKAGNGRLTVHLTVRGTGSIDLLCRQLSRLHDVAQVCVAPRAQRVAA